MTAETGLPAYIPYPLFLLPADLTQTAELLYALLLDRTTLSQKNGWMDECGHIYIIFTLGGLSDAINRGLTATKDALNELETAELIERRRRGFCAPNRIFVKLPPLSRKTDILTAGNPAIIEPENRPSHNRKSDLLIAGKPTTNHVSINHVSNNHMRGAREGDTPAPLGRYENVRLTDAELSELQIELPDHWRCYIERLSEYMASTGKNYKNHLATIRRWAADDAKKNEPKQWMPDYSYEEGESL